MSARRTWLSTVAVVAAVGLASCFPSLSTRGPSLPARARAPELELLDQRGHTVTLDALLQRGPAVLVFYRGHW